MQKYLNIIKFKLLQRIKTGALHVPMHHFPTPSWEASLPYRWLKQVTGTCLLEVEAGRSAMAPLSSFTNNTTITTSRPPFRSQWLTRTSHRGIKKMFPIYSARFPWLKQNEIQQLEQENQVYFHFLDLVNNLQVKICIDQRVITTC